MKTVLLAVFLMVMVGAGVGGVAHAQGDAVPGTGFIITGEGAPIIDMAVPLNEGRTHGGGDNVANVRGEICRSVAVMQGSDTVYSADYVGEVDVYGREVARADLNSDYEFLAPEKIDIPVRVDVLKAIGIENYGQLDMLPTLGTMTVFKGGRVFFNGRDLTPEFQVICNP